MSKPTLQSTISNIPNITEEQIGFVLPKFKPRVYSKNVFVGKEDEITRFTAYVSKGCVSNFRILENGKKAINHFAFEDWWVGDLESFLNQVPSKTYWLTLEETELMIISKEDFDLVMEKVSPFQLFFLKKTQKAFLKEMENADKDKSETAQEKYLRMMTDYPQIILRVPHYDVAAYLGITPESLSRIRNKVSKLS